MLLISHRSWSKLLPSRRAGYYVRSGFCPSVDFRDLPAHSFRRHYSTLMRHTGLAQLVQRHAAGIRITRQRSAGLTRLCLGQPSHRLAGISSRQYASPALSKREDGVSSGSQSDPSIGYRSNDSLLGDVKGLLQNGIGGSATWLQRLEEVEMDLQTPRKPRIASELV